MNEVKRKATSKYFEQEIWNNLSKQNSFEDRRLNLKYHKLEKDESITVRSWNQEQLVMLRRNKKLHDLMDMNSSRYLTLPALTTTLRSHSTTACTRGTTGSGLLSDARSRPRSHTDHCASKTDRLSTKQPTRHQEVSFPAVSAALQIGRSSHSASSQRTSLSDSEITTKQSTRTSWTRPSTQLHKRDNITPRL